MQSSLDYDSLLISANLNASEWARKELFEPAAHDLDDDRLAQSFSFDGLVRMPVVVTSIMLLERMLRQSHPR
jgi:hypothetical protein